MHLYFFKKLCFHFNVKVSLNRYTDRQKRLRDRELRVIIKGESMPSDIQSEKQNQ